MFCHPGCFWSGRVAHPSKSLDSAVFREDPVSHSTGLAVERIKPSMYDPGAHVRRMVFVSRYSDYYTMHALAKWAVFHVQLTGCSGTRRDFDAPSLQHSPSTQCLRGLSCSEFTCFRHMPDFDPICGALRCTWVLWSTRTHSVTSAPSGSVASQRPVTPKGDDVTISGNFAGVGRRGRALWRRPTSISLLLPSGVPVRSCRAALTSYLPLPSILSSHHHHPFQSRRRRRQQLHALRQRPRRLRQ